MLDSDTGELEEKTLEHEGDTVREFYSALRGPILVGIEATGSMQWFLELTEVVCRSCATLCALAMAESAYVAGLAIQNPEFLDFSPALCPSPRHALDPLTLSFFALVVSGIGILLAHPRFYWGETDAVGTPSLFDLPLPFLVTTQTYVNPFSWGRSLHFLSAWICVLPVAREERSLSRAELKRFPSRTQITHQACEEGWSFIAEWIGVHSHTWFRLRKPLVWFARFIGDWAT